MLRTHGTPETSSPGPRDWHWGFSGLVRSTGHHRGDTVFHLEAREDVAKEAGEKFPEPRFDFLIRAADDEAKQLAVLGDLLLELVVTRVPQIANEFVGEETG